MSRASLHFSYRSAVQILAIVLYSAVCAEPNFSQAKPSTAPTKPPIAPFLHFFHAFNPELEEFEFRDNKRIDASWSAIVIRATSSQASIGRSRASGDIQELLMQEAFGVFVMSAGNPKLVFALDVLPSQRFLDYEVHIIEARPQHLTISKGGGDYGMDDGRIRYFYDLERGKFLGKFGYYGMAVSTIIEYEGELYFIGSGDRTTTTITKVKHNAPSGNRDYQIIDRIAGQPVPLIDTTRVERNALVLTNEHNQYSLSGEQFTVAANPNPAEYRWNPPTGAVPELPDIGFWVPVYKVRQNFVQARGGGDLPRKLLIWNSEISSNGSARGIAPGILHLSAAQRHAYPLPPATSELFRTYRSGWIAAQRGQFPRQYDQNIGPFQLIGDMLWFGLTFYDGEGTSGIGGVGYFDTRENQFHIKHYAEIVDWSATALLVENDALWVGLARRPEGSAVPGGLARICRRSSNITKYDVPAIIRQIVRWNHSIYMSTSDGIFVWSEGKLNHLSFEPDLNGRYRLVTN